MTYPEIALMIEGQNGLNWSRWQRILHAAEALGFAGVFRSDHFTNARPPERDSLELWVSLTYAASHTRRLEFGPLVTPMSFRHPVHTARMAKDVDALSGGRLVLGVGAGWQEREHRMFGFPLGSMRERFQRLAEGLEVITRLLRSPEPVTFHGRYFHLENAVLLPPPAFPGRPPLLVGGNGLRRTLPLVARYADEWNGLFLTPERFAERNAQLNMLLEKAGRPPHAVRRSLMTGLIFAPNEKELKRKLEGRPPVEDLRQRGVLVGTPEQVREQIAALGRAGVQRLMLQWLDSDDLDGLAALAEAVLPKE